MVHFLYIYTSWINLCNSKKKINWEGVCVKAGGTGGSQICKSWRLGCPSRTKKIDLDLQVTSGFYRFWVVTSGFYRFGYLRYLWYLHLLHIPIGKMYIYERILIYWTGTSCHIHQDTCSSIRHPEHPQISDSFTSIESTFNSGSSQFYCFPSGFQSKWKYVAVIVWISKHFPRTSCPEWSISTMYSKTHYGLSYFCQHKDPMPSGQMENMQWNKSV